MFPIHLAESSGSGSGYKPEHMKDIRQYSFLPHATEEQISGMLARGILEIAEHWYAGIPGLDIQKSITDGFIGSIIAKMSSDGFQVIEPTLKSITLPFLSGREKTSNVNNYDADYIFEIDEITLVFFYEREKKVFATLFNWETEEIVETYIFPVEASQSGIYHVERLSLDLFAYSAANVSGVPQLVNILRLTPEKIEDVGNVTLPTDVKFTVCSVAISPNMKQIVMARSDPARLTLAELDDSLVLHETGELNAALLMIGDRATVDNVKFISEDVFAFSWTANNTDDVARYSGIGFYSISEEKILLDYPVSIKGIISSGNKIFTVDNASSSTVEKSNSIRVLDETEKQSLGAWYFASGYQNIYPSYLGDYFFIRIFGHRSAPTPFYFTRYSLEDQAWDKEVWMVPDPVTYNNSPPKTRSIDFVTASSFHNRFYMLALDGQKTVLNVVQHPNPQ